MARRRYETRDYRRRGPSRQPYDVVLIVCEGGKTEPHYFEGLRTACGLSNANIAVQPMGRDPLSLVNYAIGELERDDDLDIAYCVFDRDEHATFDAALRKARDHAQGKKGRLKIAASIPCFEVWPLLHFKLSTAEIVGGGGKTPGERALAEVQKVMPDYSKNDRGIFAKLADKLEVAIGNACRLSEQNDKCGADNPSTSVHHLVEYLRRLKR
jgi:hypothetical protein